MSVATFARFCSSAVFVSSFFPATVVRACVRAPCMPCSSVPATPSASVRPFDSTSCSLER